MNYIIKKIQNKSKIRVYGFSQLAKITTLFPDWKRSLNGEKG